MNFDEYLAKPNETIAQHADKLLRVLARLEELEFIKDKRLISLVKAACLHHDDGKANAAFQNRITKLTKFDPQLEVAHNVLSVYFLDKNEFENEQDYYAVAFAVLYHHYYEDPYECIINKKELIASLLKDFNVYKIKRRMLNEIQKQMNCVDAIKIKGCLHKCDYSASGGYEAEYRCDFLEAAMENIKSKWRKTNADADWNELQNFAAARRNKNIILIAQTGMGKTEAGLKWIGNNKGYFILPLRTAINAVYERVKNDILLNDNVTEKLSILHSDSLEYYTEHVEKSELDLIEYEKRGKSLAIPLNISTVDQLFDFVFKYPGYELKLTTLSYSKIVIDEIQMYDPELLAYLIYGLKKIVEMGGKIAIMTATLSPFLKDLLTAEIDFEENNVGLFTNDVKRHNVKVLDCELNASDIAKLYYQKKNSCGASGKILVVCNTIKKAQNLYAELKNEMGDYEEDLHILHSRFTKKDRAKLEQEILNFGLTFDENKNIDVKTGIWVSTSLVEASLDIDFDFLFTELQDLNSLFQRFGRCNRKGVKDISSANCFVYLNNSNKYLDKTILEVSKNAISKVSGILSEEQKINLINKSLTSENLKDSDYCNGKNGYKETMRYIEAIDTYKYKKEDNQLRNILSVDIIPDIVFNENSEEIKTAEKVLVSKEAYSTIERIQARKRIMQYSVNIPFWQYKKYQNAVKNNFAEKYQPIMLGKYNKIDVIECCYDETGYGLKDYENTIREANIL